MIDEEREALAEQVGVYTFMDKTLGQLLDNFELNLATTICFLIAELGKVGKLYSNLNAQDPRCVKMLRAIGNSCFNHDANRDLIAEDKDVIPLIMSHYNTTESSVLDTVSGCLLNISIDNENVQNLLVENGIFEHIDRLVNNVLSTGQSTFSCGIGIRTISSVIETEIGLDMFLKSPIFQHIFDLLKRTPKLEHKTEYLEAVELLFDTMSEFHNAQIALSDSKLLGVLFDFVENDEDEELGSMRLSVSKIVTSISMCDEVMQKLARDAMFVSKLKQWANSGLDSTFIKREEPIRMAGALCIANLARSDETCAILINNHQVLPVLLNLLKRETDRLRNEERDREESRDSIKVIHAVVGALNKLTLAQTYRGLIGSQGTIDRICSLFEFPYLKPVHHTGLSILKHLCGGNNDENVYRVITGLSAAGSGSLATMPVSNVGLISPINKLVTLVAKSTDEKDNGIRSEGARVIVNLIRAIHRTQALKFIPILMELNVVVYLVQAITGAILTKPANSAGEKAADENQVQFDEPPSFGPVFPIVQNEAIVALILLSTMHETAIDKIIKYKNVLMSTFLKILSSSQHTPHTKTNVCSFLKLLQENEEDSIFEDTNEWKKTIQGLLETKEHQDTSPPKTDKATVAEYSDDRRTVSKSFLHEDGASKKEVERLFKDSKEEALNPNLTLHSAAEDLMQYFNNDEEFEFQVVEIL